MTGRTPVGWLPEIQCKDAPNVVVQVVEGIDGECALYSPIKRAEVSATCVCRRRVYDQDRGKFG